jgi:hypothetical protein
VLFISTSATVDNLTIMPGLWIYVSGVENHRRLVYGGDSVGYLDSVSRPTWLGCIPVLPH